MTDQNLTGEPVQGGQTGGQPTTPVTPGTESQPSQGPEITLESVYQELQDVKQQVGKRQSVKDKAINKLEGRVENMEERIERYEAYRQQGMSPDEAKYRMEVDDIIAERRSSEQPAGAAPQPGTPSVDPQAVLSATGLQANDPDVVKILGQGGDPTAALINLSNQRKVQPNPAGMMPTGGGGTPEQDLWQQYQNEVAPVRGNQWEVAQIQAKYRAKGLQV